MEYRDYLIEENTSPWPGKFEFVHNSYDGPGDNRLGFGNSIQDCKDQIDEQIEEGVIRGSGEPDYNAPSAAERQEMDYRNYHHLK